MWVSLLKSPKEVQMYNRSCLDHFGSGSVSSGSLSCSELPCLYLWPNFEYSVISGVNQFAFVFSGCCDTKV